jgi:hypothetical protein
MKSGSIKSMVLYLLKMCTITFGTESIRGSLITLKMSGDGHSNENL